MIEEIILQEFRHIKTRQINMSSFDVDKKSQPDDRLTDLNGCEWRQSASSWQCA